MTIHVNIGKAKANLSKLISASLRGEEVVIDNDGKPQVRLIPVAEAKAEDREVRRRKIDEILERVHKIRSEEHTSELQSLMRISYAVFCLKKKKKNTIKSHVL